MLDLSTRARSGPVISEPDMRRLRIAPGISWLAIADCAWRPVLPSNIEPRHGQTHQNPSDAYRKKPHSIRRIPKLGR